MKAKVVFLEYDDGNYTNTYAYNSKNTITKNDLLSRWHAQIGVKYIF